MKPSLQNRTVKVRPFRLTTILVVVLVFTVCSHVVSVSIDAGLRLQILQALLAAFGG